MAALRHVTLSCEAASSWASSVTLLGSSISIQLVQVTSNHEFQVVSKKSKGKRLLEVKHEHYSKALSDVVKLLEKLTSYHDGNILSKWNIKLDLSVIPTPWFSYL